VEIDFFSDSRVQKMTDRSKLGYLARWFTAIKERREVLLPHQSEPSKLSVRTGISLRAVRDGLASGQVTPGSPLLIVYDTGHVRVCGVRKKHSNLKNWHDIEDAELEGRLAPKSPDQWGETRASRRAVTSRAETSRKEPPNTPANTPTQKDVLVDPLEEPKPDPNNPYRCWQQVTPLLRQSDIAMITAMHEEFRDVDICDAMRIAMDKGKSLGYVRGILHKNKANSNGKTGIEPKESEPPKGWTRYQGGIYYDAKGNALPAKGG